MEGTLLPWMLLLIEASTAAVIIGTRAASAVTCTR